MAEGTNIPAAEATPRYNGFTLFLVDVKEALAARFRRQLQFDRGQRLGKARQFGGQFGGELAVEIGVKIVIGQFVGRIRHSVQFHSIPIGYNQPSVVSC